MSKVTGAKLVAEYFNKKGVDFIFTLSGGHISPIHNEIKDSDIYILDTRHEQAAVFGAEAYGRLSRKPGIALVTAGPGFSNALSGIANAHMSQTPLVLISGGVATTKRDRLDLQDMPQLPVIAPLVKGSWVCYHTDRIPEYLDKAFRCAVAGAPGPVYLEIPIDILNNEIDPPESTPDTNVSQGCADISGAMHLLDLIKVAKRPAIIAGSGAWYSDASNELRSFVETSNIPVFTIGMARGLISDDHPLCFESALAIRPGAAGYALTNADLVIILGARVNLYFMFGYLFKKEAKIVQIDIDPGETGRNRSVDLALAGDIKAYLKALGERADNLPDKGRFQPWIDELRHIDTDAKKAYQDRWESKDIPIHPLRLCKEVADYIGPDDILIADGGDTQVWMGLTVRLLHGGRYMESGLFGCLSVGLPFANAAKAMYPDKKVLLITGDGSIGFNFMEFQTAIRHRLPVVVIVSNDHGWGMIRHSQKLKFGAPISSVTELGMVNYHLLVRDLGGHGELVEHPDEIRPALEGAFASGLPSLINVVTDPDIISPGSEALAMV
ncbi:MAG: thiamine pyrophosphate-binding protein [Deltaproteobacteria bacterium]|nr:thiamine pyrophosphate-binding protein [Deltaproteobacteria bacterium]